MHAKSPGTLIVYLSVVPTYIVLLEIGKYNDIIVSQDEITLDVIPTPTPLDKKTDLMLME